MISLEQRLTGAKCRAQANAYLAANSVTRRKGKLSLLQRINDFDGGDDDDPLLAHRPPDFIPITLKPYFYDITRTEIESDIKRTANEVDIATEKATGYLGWFRS